MPTPTRSRLSAMVVAAHLVLATVHVVLIALVLYGSWVSVTAYSTPDANIGAGIMGLALAVLGLPWSLLAFVLVDEVLPGTLLGMDSAALVAGLGALLNLGLHLGWLRRRVRRLRTGA